MPHPRVGSLAGAVEQASLQPEKVARAELLIDAKGVMMAILPFGRELDLQSINDHCRRNFQILSDTQADRLFPDCEPGSHPPLPAAYGLAAVLDESLLQQDRLFFQSGCHTTLLQVDADSFRHLNTRATRLQLCGKRCEEFDMTSGNVTSLRPTLTLQTLTERLKRLYKLPPMPAVAARILQIAADPDCNVRDLARVIEQDPSLTAQVMRYARSALFGYRGQLRNVQDAVNIVLGFDRVCHLALGIASSRAFEVPREGPLGLDAVWKHSLHASVLAQQLAHHIPKERGVDPAIAYLSGLLHNFGVLLLGHLFRPEFVMLNKLAIAEPDVPLTTLEKQVFGMGGAQELIGMGHGLMGAVLLEQWNLPPEVCKVAAVHHEEGYNGDHAPYVQVVQLANSLLKDMAIGDDLNPDDPRPLMEALGLAPEIAYEVLRQLQQNSAEILNLAKQMAA